LIASLAATRPPLREALFRMASSAPEPLSGLLASAMAAAARISLERRRGPARLILFVTRRCLLSCPFCLIDRGDHGPELSAEAHEALAASLPGPLPMLLLTGGEPLLREDLVRVAAAYVRHASTRQITVVTSGDHPDAAVRAARGILGTAANLQLSIHVSIDAPDELHDALRGSHGLFELAEQTVRRLRGMDRRLEVTVQTTIGPDNLAALPGLNAQVRRLGVPHKLQLRRGPGEVFELPPDIAGPWPTAPSLDEPGRRAAIRAAEQIYRGERSLAAHRQLAVMRLAYRVIAAGRRPVPCTAGRFDAVLWPEGGLSVCEATQPFADLAAEGLDLGRAWLSAAAQLAREQTQGCACTLPCHLTTSTAHDRRGILALLKG